MFRNAQHCPPPLTNRELLARGRHWRGSAAATPAASDLRGFGCLVAQCCLLSPPVESKARFPLAIGRRAYLVPNGKLPVEANDSRPERWAATAAASVSPADLPAARNSCETDATPETAFLYSRLSAFYCSVWTLDAVPKLKGRTPSCCNWGDSCQERGHRRTPSRARWTNGRSPGKTFCEVFDPAGLRPARSIGPCGSTGPDGSYPGPACGGGRRWRPLSSTRARH
jgi:hypothetical protein